MDYIQYILSVLIVISSYIVIIKIYMIIAAYIGEWLGFGKFFINAWKKIRR